MHWVHRGPEPIRLEPIKKRQTPSWVTCYTYGQGRPPTYHGWTSFRDDLKLAFDGLCAYCEQYTSGEVDHFRPKSLFPKEVYDWSNWVFSMPPLQPSKRRELANGGLRRPMCTRQLRSARALFRLFTTLRKNNSESGTFERRKIQGKKYDQGPETQRMVSGSRTEELDKSARQTRRTVATRSVGQCSGFC